MIKEKIVSFNKNYEKSSKFHCMPVLTGNFLRFSQEMNPRFASHILLGTLYEVYYQLLKHNSGTISIVFKEGPSRRCLTQGLKHSKLGPDILLKI